MRRVIRYFMFAAIICLSAVLMMSCSAADKTDYEHLREVSWEGTELTIKLGENKSSGCEWTTKPEDDSVIDYSINRVFHLADSQVKQGKAIGTLEAGFEGQGAGTSRVICTTPTGWDGTGAGYTYIVTVTVKEDGTIESAEGEEADQAPGTDVAETEQAPETEGEETDQASETDVEETDQAPETEGEESDQAPETEAEEAEQTPETEAEKSGEAEKTAATVEEYFTMHPDQVEEMKKNINSDESFKELVEVDLEAQGNTLSYIFTFKETYSAEQVGQFGPELQESLEGEVTEDMRGRIPAIEQSFGVTGVSVHMEYRNGDGSIIAETTVQ